MKILTICQGGTVRSVCLARLLKDRDVKGRAHDALAASWQWNSPATLEFLGAWADRVIVMERYMLGSIPEALLGKAMVCDVGPDRFGHSQNPELMAICLAWMEQNGL